MVKIHDVTVPLVPGLAAFPGDPPLQVERLQQAGDAPYGLSRLSLTTHSGTHVDAPSHFVAGGATVDQLPLEILMGKTRVVELLARERVERADLESLDLRDDVALVALTHSIAQHPRSTSPRQQADLESAWEAGQNRWLRLSSAGRLERVDLAGHDIAAARPEVVVRRVRGLLPR